MALLRRANRRTRKFGDDGILAGYHSKMNFSVASEADIRDRISKLVRDTEERQAVVTDNQSHVCPVIELPLDMLVLNHSSMRICDALEDSDRWNEELKKNPRSEEAQAFIAEAVRGARSEADFDALVESISIRQEQPGHISFTGVLINANTRKVALASRGDNSKSLRVFVLPDHFGDREFALLEEELQGVKELKEKYRLIPQLKTIARERFEFKMSVEAIMERHRLSGAKGKREVEMWLAMLPLIEEMQQMPTTSLKNAFFNSFEMRNMKEVYDTVARYDREADLDGRERYLLTIIIAIASGGGAVHPLQQMDADFFSEFVLEPLYANEDLCGVPNERFLKPLVGRPDDPHNCDLEVVANLLSAPAKDVVLAESPKRLTVRKEALKSSINDAIARGVKEKKKDDKTLKQIDRPADELRKAIDSLQKCGAALEVVRDDPEFRPGPSGKLQLKFRKDLALATKDLEKKLKDAEILE
jgi:hypothetical protein